MSVIEVHWLGERSFTDAQAVQDDVHADVLARRRPDTLLLMTHPPVLVCGRSGSKPYLLATDAELERRGIGVESAPRGGGMAFHHPGQLVAWLVMDLDRLDRDFARLAALLEEVAIEALALAGVTADRGTGQGGIWIGERKIAQLGVAVRRWVSAYGIAIDVTGDLTPFDFIVPCGPSCGPHTSIAAEVGDATTVDGFRGHFISAFRRTFGGGVVVDDIEAVPPARLARDRLSI